MSSPFFVTFQPRPEARLRLVCLPYSGGAAHVFRRWLQFVPEDIELVGVQLPGRWTRHKEPPFRRIPPLVDALAEALASLSDRPFALFGHSLGALLAFELARALKPESMPVHVFVSARRAPHMPLPDSPIFTLDDPSFVREVVRRYEGIPAQVVQDRELLALVLPALRADMEAFETYEYQEAPPISVPLTAFTGADDPNCSPGQIEEWRRHTSRKFEHRAFAGGHFFIQPCERDVVSLIAATLSTAPVGGETIAPDPPAFFDTQTSAAYPAGAGVVLTKKVAQPLEVESSAKEAAVSPRILLVDSDAKHLRSFSQILTRVAEKPDTCASLNELETRSDYELLVINYDALASTDRERVAAMFSGDKRSSRILLLSDGKIKEDFVSLFGTRALTNLLARRTEDVDVDELIVTLQKILQRDIFGIEKYFVWGVTTSSTTISSSRDKSRVLSMVEEYTRDIGIHPRLATLFTTVADEFVSNAIYNAPVGTDGTSRFGHVPRTAEVSLEPHESVAVKFCCDGRRLGISTVDPFGSISQETILDYLAKCFRKSDDQVDQKSGGAGLGFYQIFDALSHFVVNIEPGKRTEMIGLIDVRGSYKDFAIKGKSFNIFVGS